MSGKDELHVTPSAGRLLKFTGWNLFGLCTPMLVAFFALPLLRGRMGEDIYGAFMFLLTVINYLTILDLGLGRAVTQFIAARLANRKEDDLPAVFWTAQGMMAGFAVAGMLVFFPLIPSVVGNGSRIPPALQLDAARTLFAAGLGTPFLVLTASLVGALEAHRKFKLINLIRLPMQIYTFLGPLAVATVSQTLLAPVVALLAGKVLECAIYFGACLWEVPVLRRGVAFQRGLIPPLFAMGGWMSVSGIAMLVLNQANSVLMFALLPVAMVGFYATIAEMIVRLLVFPKAWVSVLFPSFTAQHALGTGGLPALYAKGVRSLLVFAFPVILGLVAFAWEGLWIWQDAAFASTAAGAMRWLTAGIFLLSLSMVPLSLLQGIGRPDLSAKVHLVMIPVSLGLAWVLIGRLGMEGAGLAWFIRCALESSAMTMVARRFVPGAAGSMRRSMAMVLLALALCLAMACMDSLAARIALYPVMTAGFLALAWFWLATPDERDRLRTLIARKG